MPPVPSPVVAVWCVLPPPPPLEDVARVWLLDFDDAVRGEVPTDTSTPRKGPHSAWTRCDASTASWYRSRLYITSCINVGGANMVYGYRVERENRKISRGSNCCPGVFHVCSWLHASSVPWCSHTAGAVLRTKCLEGELNHVAPSRFCGLLSRLPRQLGERTSTKALLRAARLLAGSVLTWNNSPQPSHMQICRWCHNNAPIQIVLHCQE